jgi:hypothetical protein
MSVIVSKHDSQHPRPDTKCTLCDGPLHPPFILWTDRRTLFFCRRCSVDMQKGFRADLAQLHAIDQLQEIFPSYPHFTLLRRTQATADAEAQRDR